MAVTAATLRTVFGIIGNVISLCLFLSPAPTFYNVWKWKSTREYSGIPYVATLLNCMLWVFYGIPIVHPNSILVVTINGTGVFLEGIYVMMFVIYCSKDTRVNMLKILALVALLFALFVVLTLMLAHTHDRRSLIVGFLCVVFGTCMYAAPLSVIVMFDTWTQSLHCQTVPCWRLCRLLSQCNDRKVVSSKSVKYMPLPLSLASFLNGTVWMAYACIHFDIFITIPNGLGACLSGLQLMLYAKYYRTTVWEDDKEVTMKVEASA